MQMKSFPKEIAGRCSCEIGIRKQAHSIYQEQAQWHFRRHFSSKQAQNFRHALERLGRYNVLEQSKTRVKDLKGRTVLERLRQKSVIMN